MAKWVVSAKRADFDKIGQTFHIDPVLARIIRNRDVCDEQDIQKYLNGTEADMYDPHLLKGIDEAADKIRQYIANQKKIRIIGDYDADGICSTYILVKGLMSLGADVDYAIPHRVRDGYGINESMILTAKEAGREVIITCDNGIAAVEQIKYAYSLGLEVIVTDHHEIPYEEAEGERKYILPAAEVVIDPKQPGDTYPNSGICGAVVAYKLIQVLCSDNSALLADLLEIAAIATVTDVMELLDENRIIVKTGLSRMEHTKNLGLKALLQVNGIWGKKMTGYHIGFVIGPCLNAAGRLDVADKSLELLLCEDERKAVNLATQLKDINDSRKSMTEQNVEVAVTKIESETDNRVLVVYLPECHESLAGIIAGRIKELYYKPTFVLTDGEDGIKGSGRSIPGYNMYDALTEVKDLLTKFGGHSMAAGVSLEKVNLELFAKRLNSNCKLTKEDLEKKITIDVPMPFAYCSFDLINQLDLLEPFGNGNQKPVFAQKKVKVLSGRIMGKNKNVGKYVVEDEQKRRYEMIYFGDLEEFASIYEEKPETVFNMLYYPSINEYNGRRSIQLVLQDYMVCGQ